MTIEDAKVIGFGTLALLVLFVSAQVIYLSRASIVAFFSGEWSRSLEKARTQKAVREQLYGYATVNDYADAAPVVMSRSDDSAPASWRPSLETQAETDRQTEETPRIKAAELLTLYKLLRELGCDREPAAAAFKASGLPFNNNVWRDAEPPAKPAAPAPYVTPIVGRPTSAKFESDPDYPFEPCRT